MAARTAAAPCCGRWRWAGRGRRLGDDGAPARGRLPDPGGHRSRPGRDRRVRDRHRPGLVRRRGHRGPGAAPQARRRGAGQAGGGHPGGRGRRGARGPGGLGLAVGTDQLPHRRPVRQLPLAGHRRRPRPRPGRRAAHAGRVAGVGPGRFRAPHRQGARQQPGHARAVPQIRVRGGPPHDGTPRGRPAGERGMTAGGTVPDGTVRGGTVRGGTVKCVVWDIDNTLLTGTYLESPDEPPGADPVLGAVLAELGARGILHALASKNPPEAAAHTARVTGWRFAAAECGWGSKSGALTKIAATLGIAVDALAFVDDDPYERAEVGSALPGVLVLSPEEAAEAAGWPEFSPPVITAEARRRGEIYAERQRRQEAGRAFGGTREEFLASAGTQVTIAAATAADVPRLAELAARTRQFNSAAGRDVGAPGEGMTQDWFGGLLTAPDQDVVTVRLRDAFGDDGMVGGCVITRDAGTWTVPLLMMSCRAMGRGVIDAVLAWLTRQAARAGA